MHSNASLCNHRDDGLFPTVSLNSRAFECLRCQALDGDLVGPVSLVRFATARQCDQLEEREENGVKAGLYYPLG